MPPTPIPPSEQKRLQALRELEILDTEPEQEFDDLSRLASIVCDTPVALVSLIDAHRQWFKSRYGVDAVETPRDIAFCSHAIAEDVPDVFVIPDATADPRFAGNPLVTDDPSIRFYAGAVITTSEGFPLGTVCAIDRRPRQIEPHQVEALRAIARLVMRLLEARLQRQKLTRLGKALVESNHELGQFASLAAHDLKAPLRNVQLNAERLQDRNLEQLDSSGQERVTALVRLSTRMTGLVNDVLAYSEVIELDPVLESVDLGQLVADITADLASSLEEAGATIVVPAPLPTLVTDPGRVATVLRNLISNALRYSDAEARRIEVGVRDGTPRAIYVRDNGIGIAPEFHTEIFEPFRRLHGQSEYGGGNGFGLATVRRTIERLGGRIWVESEIGKGATFLFTLGDQPAAVA